MLDVYHPTDATLASNSTLDSWQPQMYKYRRGEDTGPDFLAPMQEMRLQSHQGMI